MLWAVHYEHLCCVLMSVACIFHGFFLLKKSSYPKFLDQKMCTSYYICYVVIYVVIPSFFVLGVIINYIWQWRAWTGLEDRMRLPWTIVTSGWPLAKVQNPLSLPPGNSEISGSRLVDLKAGINQQTSCLAEIMHCLAEIWCNWTNDLQKWGTVTVGEEMGVVWPTGMWTCPDTHQSIPQLWVK